MISCAWSTASAVTDATPRWREAGGGKEAVTRSASGVTKQCFVCDASPARSEAAQSKPEKRRANRVAAQATQRRRRTVSMSDQRQQPDRVTSRRTRPAPDERQPRRLKQRHDVRSDLAQVRVTRGPRPKVMRRRRYRNVLRVFDQHADDVLDLLQRLARQRNFDHVRSPSRDTLITVDVAALPVAQKLKLIAAAVRSFDAFDTSDDPYAEHDFGAVRRRRPLFMEDRRLRQQPDRPLARSDRPRHHVARAHDHACQKIEAAGRKPSEAAVPTRGPRLVRAEADAHAPPEVRVLGIEPTATTAQAAGPFWSGRIGPCRRAVPPAPRDGYRAPRRRQADDGRVGPHRRPAAAPDRPRSTASGPRPVHSRGDVVTYRDMQALRTVDRRWRILLRVEQTAVSAAVLLFLTGCTGVLDPHGPVGASEKLILLNSLAIMLAIVIPTILATVACAWWFRASNEKATYWPDWTFSGQLELIVWGIPTLVITFLGGIAWFGSHALDPYKPLNASIKPVEVEVVSLDWKWLFIYPDDGVAAVNRACHAGRRPGAFPVDVVGRHEQLLRASAWQSRSTRWPA